MQSPVTRALLLDPIKVCAAKGFDPGEVLQKEVALFTDGVSLSRRYSAIKENT